MKKGEKVRRNTALPELLAPAGDMQALYAAALAGADAIYVGGKRFGARAFAKNFDDAQLALAASYCHLHGVRLYVTVNTLVYDKEAEELAAFVKYLYKIGVDAVIVADLGAVEIIKRAAPSLEIHASTQMSVHNTEGANMAAQLGCTRVVLARELSLEDICEISKECVAETEVFLHGALCVCHSGQCLFSSLVGGRSGNRGECAQPCRLPYNGQRALLSLSDLSLAEHIPELIKSGTASLKIEGRMKSADYVFGVTSIYRRLLDEGRSATPCEISELSRIFSRGFTDGYFTGRLTSMTGVRSEEAKSETRQVSGRVFEPQKRKVSAVAHFKIGQACDLTLTDGKHSATVTGEVVEQARSVPLDEASIKARLAKMGNTFLALDESDITLVLDDGANLPIGAINALRRKGAERFCMGEERQCEECEITPPPKIRKKQLRTALFLNPQVLLECDGAVRRHFDVLFAPLFSDRAVFEVANGVYLPPVLKNSEMKRAKERLLSLGEGVKYALVGNLSHVPLAKEAGLIPIADIRMNVTSSYTREVLTELGVNDVILSAELDLPKARDVFGTVTVYGRIPLMITERCFIKENFSCKACENAALTDRRGKKFPLVREFEHRNLVLNSEITYMADRLDDVLRFSLGEHFIFTKENAREVSSVLQAFKTGAKIDTVFQGERPRRIGSRTSSGNSEKKQAF